MTKIKMLDGDDMKLPTGNEPFPKIWSDSIMSNKHKHQGCGNTMPDLSELVPFHSGQVENFNLLVLAQVQNLYKVAKI